MESARTFLFILFAFLTFLLYNQWQEAHKPEPISKAPIESSLDNYSPQGNSSNPSVTLQSPDTDLSSELPTDPAIPVNQNTGATQQPPIKVTTDKLRVLITPQGGNFISAELLGYRETLNDDSAPINILENRNKRVFLALSGLYGEGAPDFKQNIANYQSSQTEYTLADGQDSLDVDLRWVNAKGIEYIKRFTFHRDTHTVDVKYIVSNSTDKRFANRMFTSLKRDTLEAEGQTSEGIGMTSFVGPAYSTAETPYEKFSFDEVSEEGLNAQTQNGWVAILQHYFVTAWIPRSETVNRIDATDKELGRAGLSQIRITQDWLWLEPGDTAEFEATLYVGPKIQSRLEGIAEGLELTVDYGFLWWIGQPIFHLLIFFQSFAVNWGLAIILVTLAIKNVALSTGASPVPFLCKDALITA